MPEQEKTCSERSRTIQEGIAKILAECDGREWDITPESFCDEYRADAGRLINYLHSQGVGLRGKSLGATHPHLANYYTIEPLVKEVKNGS